MFQDQLDITTKSCWLDIQRELRIHSVDRRENMHFSCYMHLALFERFHKMGFYVLLNLVSAIFYRIFIFHQMIALQKLWKVFFISSKKLFSFSRYSNFCNFSLPFHNFQLQKDRWKWNKLWCHKLFCINLQMQFLVR